MKKSKSPHFSLTFIASLFLHGAVFLFFFITPADIPRVGNPVVSIDVIPAATPAPAPVAKVKPLPHTPHQIVKPVVQTATAPTSSPEPISTPQAATSSAPPPTTSGGGTNGSVMSAYVLKIVDLLNRSKIYPQEAIDREQEGRVVIAVTLAADGKLKEAKVVEASNYGVLNRAALQTVQRIAQFPVPPNASGEFHFTAPLQYKIERR